MDVDRLLDPHEPTEFVVADDEDGERLDALLHFHAPWLSRTRIQEAVRAGLVTVDDRLADRPGQKLDRGDRVHARLPKTPRDLFVDDATIPPVDVVHDGGDFLVLAKPPGLAAHPSGGDLKLTVAVIGWLISLPINVWLLGQPATIWSGGIIVLLLAVCLGVGGRPPNPPDAEEVKPVPSLPV